MTLVLAMSTLSVAFASYAPVMCCPRLRFGSVFLRVAPVAQALQILERVVHVVPVLVVHLAASCFSAAFTWALWQEAFCRGGRAVAGLCSSVWVEALSHTLTLWAAIRDTFEAVTASPPHLRVGMVLVSRAERLLADWASLCRVLKCHNAQYYMTSATDCISPSHRTESPVPGGISRLYEPTPPQG